MAAENATGPTTVDWSGENPGMYLEEHPDGPFVTEALNVSVTDNVTPR